MAARALRCRGLAAGMPDLLAHRCPPWWRGRPSPRLPLGPSPSQSMTWPIALLLTRVRSRNSKVWRSLEGRGWPVSCPSSCRLRPCADLGGAGWPRRPVTRFSPVATSRCQLRQEAEYRRRDRDAAARWRLALPLPSSEPASRLAGNSTASSPVQLGSVRGPETRGEVTEATRDPGPILRVLVVRVCGAFCASSRCLGRCAIIRRNGLPPTRGVLGGDSSEVAAHRDRHVYRIRVSPPLQPNRVSTANRARGSHRAPQLSNFDTAWAGVIPHDHRDRRRRIRRSVQPPARNGTHRSDRRLIFSPSSPMRGQRHLAAQKGQRYSISETSRRHPWPSPVLRPAGDASNRRRTPISLAFHSRLLRPWALPATRANMSASAAFSSRTASRRPLFRSSGAGRQAILLPAVPDGPARPAPWRCRPCAHSRTKLGARLGQIGHRFRLVSRPVPSARHP